MEQECDGQPLPVRVGIVGEWGEPRFEDER